MAENKRVLILAVRFGNGHWQTALTLKKALLDAHPTIEVDVVNYLQFAGYFFDILIRLFYHDLMIRVPPLYRFFFRYTDRKTQNSFFQRFVKTVGAPAFLLYVTSTRPDVIISTYPVPAAVVAWLKQRRLIKCTLVTVITDYMLHQTWIQPGTDLYIAPSETVAGELIRQGILPEQVAVTGIPIDHRFMDEASRALPGLLSDLPEELQGLPVVLLISGATNFGGDLSRICRLLAGLPVPHVAVVLGVRYPQRRLNLTRLVSKGRNRVFIVGYSQEVPMFMAAASCMISKAGGITISEALATELPMIIYKALPCQEEMNRDFLTREGAALAARNLNELGRMLGDVLQNEGLRARMENAAARLKHPDAASAAVSRMAPYLEKQKPEARSRRLALTIKAGRKAGRRIQKRFRHPINGIRLLFYVNNRRAKRKKPPRL